MEWCTAKENTDHAFKTGLRKIRCGENATDSKISEKTANKICKMLEENVYGTREIADKLGVDFHIVSNIKHKKCWLDVSINYNIDNHKVKSKPIKHKKNKCTKITKKQAELVCIYLEQSSLSVKEISKRLNIKPCKINAILYENAWKNVSCKYDFSNRRRF